MRLNADFNVSLSGLEAELAKALKPLENLLRQASGNKNAKVQFTEAGTEFFGQSLANLNQRYNLGLSPQDLKVYQDLFAKASAAKEAMTDAIKEGKSGDAARYMLEMSQAVQGLFHQLAQVTSNIQAVQQDLTSGAKSLQATVNQALQARTKVKKLTGQAAQQVAQDLTALETVLTQLDSKTASQQLGRQVNLTKALSHIRNFKSLGIDTDPKKGLTVNFEGLKKLTAALGSTFKDLDDLEQALNRRSQEDLKALEAIRDQLQNAQLGGLTRVAADAGRSRGLKNALGTGRANAEARLQSQAFSLLYGREPKSPEDDELFQQFVQTLGPTVNEFRSQLYNIFSNTIGSLGAAAVFLTANAIAKTSDDLAGLTKNLQVYQNLLESRGEQVKAQDIASLRKEMVALAGVSEQTVTKLSQALVEVARLGGSTEGFTSLVSQARVAYQQYGLDANNLLQQAQGVLLNQRRSSIDPGMLAEITALAGPQADKALENFDKLVSSQAGLTLSYEQLRNAAIAYAKSGHEVQDSLAQVLEYAQKGTELYPKLAEEAERAGKKMAKSFLFAQDQEVFKAQQQVGAAITETLLGTFDAAGLGQGSKAILTMQTTLLGLLTVIEQFMRLGGEFLDWLNSLQVAGVRAGDLVRIVGAIVAMTTALKALTFIGKVVGGQLLDTAEAWKRLGDASRSKKVLGEALEEAVKGVGRLRGGLSALGPVLSMLFGMFRTAFGPIGLAVTAVTALGAWAFQSSQARKAEAAALDARTGRNLVYDENGNSRFRSREGSLTYALGGREIDVNKALATLKNIDLAAAQIGVSNADIEGAQDLRDLYQVVKRYRETRASFERQQAKDLEKLKNQLTQAQQALASVERQLAEAGNADKQTRELNELRAKVNSGQATPQDVWRLGELMATAQSSTRNLLEQRTSLALQVSNLQNKLQAASQSNPADAQMQQLVEAFKGLEPILESIKNYDDALATVQLYQEYGLKKLKAEVDYSKLDRFEQQEREALALANALKAGLARESNPTRRQTFLEAIAEAQDKALDARLSRLKEAYALASDDINTLPTGYTRYNESLRNLENYLAGLKAEYAKGRAAGATTEKLRSLQQDIRRAENDILQANNALSGYRVQLERTRDQAVLALEKAIRPATEFISDTSSFTYKLVTQVEDVLKQYQNATADEFASTVPALLQRFDQLFSQALNADIDRRMVDEYIQRAKAKKDEYERIDALLRTFSANKNRLRDKSGAGLAYLVDESSKLFFGDGGIVSNLETLLEGAQGVFEAFKRELSPRTGSEADSLGEKALDGLKKVEQAARLLARLDTETPAIKAAFIQSRTRQLDDLYYSIRDAQNQVKRYQQELQKLAQDRVKNADSIKTTKELLARAEARLQSLVAQRPEFERLLQLAGEDAVRYVEQTKAELEKQAQAMVDAQLKLLGRFREFLARQHQATQRSLESALDPLRKYQESVQEPSIEKITAEVEAQAQSLEEQFQDQRQAYNQAAYEALSRIDALLAQDAEYKAILQALRSSQDPRVQAEKRAYLEAKVQKKLAELRGKQAQGTLSDDEKGLLASLETNLALLEFYTNQRDLYNNLLKRLPQVKEDEKAAGRAKVYKDQAERALKQAEESLKRLEAQPVGRLEDDLQVLSEVSQAYGAALQQSAQVLGTFSADQRAARLVPQTLSDLRNAQANAAKQLQERTKAYLNARLDVYLKDLSSAAQAQDDLTLTEVEKELARRRGLAALADLQTLQGKLNELGLDPRDQQDYQDRIRQTIASSAEVFRQLLGFEGFDLSDGEFLKDLEPVRAKLAEYGVGGLLGEAVLRALYGPEAVRAVEQMLERLENSTDDELLQNGMGPSLITSNLISALAASGLDPKGDAVAALRKRLEAQQKRLEKLSQSAAFRQLSRTVNELNRQAESAEQEELLVEAVKHRLDILQALDTALLDPQQDRESLQDMRRDEIDRLQKLLTSSKFVPQALGQELLQAWAGTAGSPQERAEQLARQAIQAVPELAALPEEVQQTLVQAALKPILPSVSEAARKAAELILKGYALKKAGVQADFTLDPATALAGLSEVVAAYQQVAFEQVKAAKTAFDNAQTPEEQAQASVNLQSAVLEYLQSYRSFLEDLAQGLEGAYSGGKLSDAEYAQALKTLESLSVNPVLLVNQLTPLAQAIGMGEGELKKLVSGFLDLSQRLKQMREVLEQAKLAILADPQLSKSQREYALKAAEVQAKLNDDTPNSKGDLERAQSLRQLVFDYLDRLVKDFEQSLPQGLDDGERTLRVNTYRDNLASSLASLDAQALFERLGLKATPEQLEQYLPVLLAALKDAREDIKRSTELLQSLLTQLLAQLQNMLQNFFMEVMGIPTRLAEEARARAEKASQLQGEMDLVAAQIEEYKRLYEVAVKNYGAASEQAERYRQKLAELRGEQRKLSEEFRKNEQSAKSFFDYLLEALANFLKAFANAIQQLIAQQMALRVVKWLGGLLDAAPAPSSSSGNPPTNPTSTKPDVQNAPSATLQSGPNTGTVVGQAVVGTGSTVATQVGGAALNSALGIAGTSAAFLGPLTVGMAIGVIANGIANLVQEYADREQDHRQAGINRFEDNPFNLSARKRVEIHLHGQYDRQKLAAEAGAKVYQELGRELLD
jgi:hypothetical protein